MCLRSLRRSLSILKAVRERRFRWERRQTHLRVITLLVKDHLQLVRISILISCSEYVMCAFFISLSRLFPCHFSPSLSIFSFNVYFSHLSFSTSPDLNNLLHVLHLAYPHCAVFPRCLHWVHVYGVAARQSARRHPAGAAPALLVLLGFQLSLFSRSRYVRVSCLHAFNVTTRTYTVASRDGERSDSNFVSFARFHPDSLPTETAM